MTFAAEDGCQSVVRLRRDFWATNIEQTMLCAAGNGHESMVHLCYNWVLKALLLSWLTLPYMDTLGL